MSNLANAFAGIKEAQAEPSPKPAPAKAAAKKTGVPQAKEPATPKAVTGKSSHEDYGSLKVYVRKETRRKAERKWEDEGGGDLSDLVEHLLSRYIGS